MRKFKLLRDILEFKAGTIVEVEGDYIHLGYGDWGWEIPLFIVKRNPEWFEPILGY